MSILFERYVPISSLFPLAQFQRKSMCVVPYPLQFQPPRAVASPDPGDGQRTSKKLKGKERSPAGEEHSPSERTPNKRIEGIGEGKREHRSRGWSPKKKERPKEASKRPLGRKKPTKTSTKKEKMSSALIIRRSKSASKVNKSGSASELASIPQQKCDIASEKEQIWLPDDASAHPHESPHAPLMIPMLDDIQPHIGNSAINIPSGTEIAGKLPVAHPPILTKSPKHVLQSLIPTLEEVACHLEAALLPRKIELHVESCHEDFDAVMDAGYVRNEGNLSVWSVFSPLLTNAWAQHRHPMATHDASCFPRYRLGKKLLRTSGLFNMILSANKEMSTDLHSSPEGDRSPGGKGGASSRSIPVLTTAKQAETPFILHSTGSSHDESNASRNERCIQSRKEANSLIWVPTPDDSSQTVHWRMLRARLVESGPCPLSLLRRLLFE